jgi:hypothetical protein
VSGGVVKNSLVLGRSSSSRTGRNGEATLVGDGGVVSFLQRVRANVLGHHCVLIEFSHTAFEIINFLI